jgi:hypothetical protein
VTVLAVVFAAIGFAQVARADQLLYEQQFNNESSSGNVGLASVGWWAFAGSAATDQSNVADGCTISPYIGSGSTPGFAFAKSGTYTAPETLLGSELPTPLDRLAYRSLTFSWDQWVGELGLASRLFISVGNSTQDCSLYVSKDVFSNASVYGLNGTTVTNGETKSISLSSISGWYALTATPNVLMSASPTEVSLPTTGNILHSGLYCTGAAGSTAAILIDNFQINGSAVPEPSTLALSASGLLGLLAYAWKRRNS